VPSVPPGEARLYFGVTTWDDWSTPNEIDVSVLLDTNDDGKYEFRLANGTPTPPIFGSGPVGPLLSQLYDTATGQIIAQQPLNGVDPLQFDSNLYFTNALVLPVRLADLGLSPGGGTIHFVVQTTSADTLESEGRFIDRTPVLRYDPSRPALRFSPPPAAAQAYLDQEGAEIAVALEPAGYPFNPPAGVLVLHHHNGRATPANTRGDTVLINYRWPWTSYLPIIRLRAQP
jgi:hypothetical protein